MNIIDLNEIETGELVCRGCTNQCNVLRFRFPNGHTAYSGNKCEKIFSSKHAACAKGYNAFEVKNAILFGIPVGLGQLQQTQVEQAQVRPSPSQQAQATLRPVSAIRIGIPRALNMYENFPFWKTLLEGCGFEVVLSPESNTQLYTSGIGSVMSDNICFPAKLAHGHIFSLIEAMVDRIFYPIIPKEETTLNEANNSFNCPVVSGYPEVIRSAINPLGRYGIPFDKPVINMADAEVLKEQCRDYVLSLVPRADMFWMRNIFETAFENADRVRKNWCVEFVEDQRRVLDACVKNGAWCFVVAGRPYHADSLIHQKVGQILSDLGVNVLTDDVFRPAESRGFGKLNLVSQWAYPNRVVQAALEVAKLPPNIQLVQLNSFGCGPDSFFMDETGEILRHGGKHHTILRIDEIAAPGSIRLRCRSLVESLKK